MSSQASFPVRRLLTQPEPPVAPASSPATGSPSRSLRLRRLSVQGRVQADAVLQIHPGGARFVTAVRVFDLAEVGAGWRDMAGRAIEDAALLQTLEAQITAFQATQAAAQTAAQEAAQEAERREAEAREAEAREAEGREAEVVAEVVAEPMSQQRAREAARRLRQAARGGAPGGYSPALGLPTSTFNRRV